MTSSPGAGMPEERSAYELWLACPECGDVVLPAETCGIYLDLAHDTHLVTYRCPGCHRRTNCALDEDRAQALIARGFVVRVLTIAAELHEPRPHGPAFQWDDLLAFHEILSGSEDLATRR